MVARLLLASTVFASSAAFASPTSTTTPYLDLGIDLHAKVLFDGDGSEYVGFPTSEAEILLLFLEEKVPAANQLLNLQDELVLGWKGQAQSYKELFVLSSSNTVDALALAEMWKTTANDLAKSNLLDDLFSSPYLWGSVAFVLGVLSGVGVYALVQGGN